MLLEFHVGVIYPVPLSYGPVYLGQNGRCATYSPTRRAPYLIKVGRQWSLCCSRPWLRVAAVPRERRYNLMKGGGGVLRAKYMQEVFRITKVGTLARQAKFEFPYLRARCSF